MVYKENQKEIRIPAWREERRNDIVLDDRKHRTSDLSTQIWIMKAFAILSVICAHTTMPQGTFGGLISAIYARIGTIGMPVFLFLSGYFHPFASNCDISGTMGARMKRKLISIVLPWGTAVLLHLGIKTIGGDVPNVKVAVNFAFGNGSFFYFVTVLVIIDFFFSVLHAIKMKEWHKDVILWVLVLANALSVMSAAMGYGDSLNQNAFPFTYVNPYLNPANWIGFYSLGIWAHLHGKMEWLNAQMEKRVWRILVPTFSIAVICGSCFVGNAWWYFDFVAIPAEVGGLMLMFFLSGLVVFQEMLSW